MDTTAAIAAKVRRLGTTEAPRVLDLFAGCGGLSLGFKAAGFESLAAIELDSHAAASHGRNFHPGSAAHAEAIDITQVSPAEFAARQGWDTPECVVDVIIGGPPCQAFARIGRPKLVDIAANPRAFLDDARAGLYLRYLEYVEFFKPLALLVENVPDVMNHGGQNIAANICELLDGHYSTGYTLLNAARYGVPQMRERMFLMAYRHELEQPVTFPSPTHCVTLPQGYAGLRQVAMKTLDAFDLYRHHFLSPPEPATTLTQPAVTARQAIGDLPVLCAHLPSSEERERPGPGAALEEASAQPSQYAEAMRTWSGYLAPAIPDAHVVRRLPRDWPIFARMRAGDQYPEAHRLALAILEERARHKGIPEDTPEYAALRKQIVPPYSVEKFHGKWRKLDADRPVHTVTAHLSKDTYSHIHYDSRQARTISVREAARLQSFPDGFTFSGRLNADFRQIGNSVPPILAKVLAATMLQALRRAASGGRGYGVAPAAGTTPEPPMTVGHAVDANPSLHDMNARA